VSSEEKSALTIPGQSGVIRAGSRFLAFNIPETLSACDHEAVILPVTEPFNALPLISKIFSSWLLPLSCPSRVRFFQDSAMFFILKEPL